MFSVGFFMGMWIFQINLRSAYGLHVPHFIVSVSCSVGLVLVWSWSGPGLDSVSPCLGLGLDSVSPCLGLGLDLVSTPQSLGLVSVSIHSGLGHDLVSV